MDLELKVIIDFYEKFLNDHFSNTREQSFEQAKYSVFKDGSERKVIRCDNLGEHFLFELVEFDSTTNIYIIKFEDENKEIFGFSFDISNAIKNFKD